MNNRVKVLKSRPDKTMTQEHQAPLEPVNAVHGVFEAIFAPEAPVLASVPTHGEPGLLNSLVEQLHMMPLTLAPGIAHCVGLALQRGVPVEDTKAACNDEKSCFQ